MQFIKTKMLKEKSTICKMLRYSALWIWRWRLYNSWLVTVCDLFLLQVLQWHKTRDLLLSIMMFYLIQIWTVWILILEVVSLLLPCFPYITIVYHGCPTRARELLRMWDFLMSSILLKSTESSFWNDLRLADEVS